MRKGGGRPFPSRKSCAGGRLRHASRSSTLTAGKPATLLVGYARDVIVVTQTDCGWGSKDPFWTTFKYPAGRKTKEALENVFLISVCFFWLQTLFTQPQSFCLERGGLISKYLGLIGSFKCDRTLEARTTEQRRNNVLHLSDWGMTTPFKSTLPAVDG